MLRDIIEHNRDFPVKTIKRRVGLSQKHKKVWFLYTYVDYRKLSNKSLVWADREIMLRKHLNNNDLSIFDYDEGKDLLKQLK